MRLELDGEATLYVPEPIEAEKTEIFTRLDLAENPTTIFDRDELPALVFPDEPTVVAKGSALIPLATEKTAPVPPRRRAITPICLDDSYEAAMRAFV